MSQKYDKEYKVQAVLLARKIGNSNAAKELKVPEGTLYGWIKAAKVGELSFRCRQHGRRRRQHNR